MSNKFLVKKEFAAIILAAGKGKRLKSKHRNKVVLPLGEKPMIVHTTEFLKNLGASSIVVVVGFAKESIEKVLAGEPVVYAVQKKRLGTAHALSAGLTALPSSIEHVMVVNGDDALFYNEKNSFLIKQLLEKHFSTGAAMTIMTINISDSFGQGRIVRDLEGKVISIVEEKDATEKQKEIKEINSGCYIFKTSFLRQYLKKVKKSPITGEYYLVSLVEIAVKNHEKVEVIQAGSVPWRGVNTPEDLLLAEQIFSQQA